jgi:hypothetical protein
MKFIMCVLLFGTALQAQTYEAELQAARPGANFCMKCGRKPYLLNCKCGYKAAEHRLEPGPAYWMKNLKFCPTCRSKVIYNNGCLECPNCVFQFVIDPSKYKYENNIKLRNMMRRRIN